MNALPMAFAVLLALLIAVCLVAVQALKRTIRAIQEGVGHLSDTLSRPFGIEEERRLVGLEDLVDALPKKWEEMVKDARRAEERARGHVKGALKELEERGFESPALEAVGRELRIVDANGGDPARVPAVRPVVEEGGEPSEEDWAAYTLRAKYGPQGR